MTRYDEIKAATNKAIQVGLCHSLPVPVSHLGAEFDGMFLFSISHKTHEPNEPCRVILVSRSSEQIIDAPANDFFSGLVFSKSEFKPVREYRELINQASNLYDEVIAGDITDASERYAAILRAVSQDCLIQYYAALSPALFNEKPVLPEEVTDGD